MYNNLSILPLSIEDIINVPSCDTIEIRKSWLMRPWMPIKYEVRFGQKIKHDIRFVQKIRYEVWFANLVLGMILPKNCNYRVIKYDSQNLKMICMILQNN